MNDDQLTSQRRRLAGALKQLRLDHGISAQALGGALGWSQSKVSKIENGVTAPAAEDVRRWVQHFAVEASEADALVELAAEIGVHALAWRDVRRRGAAEDQRRRADVGAQTTSVAVYQSEVVPGLLQTPDYARSLLEVHSQVPAEVVGEAVRTRLDRQTALFDPERQFEFLITERALRWRPGSVATTLAQLDRIRSLATLPNVRIGVISRAAESHAKPLHSFVVLRFPDHSEVEIETLTAELAVTAEQDVALYEKFLDEVREHASFDDGLHEVLDAIAAELRACSDAS